MKKQLIFEFERETKGAVRYFELDPANHERVDKDAATIGTIYIRKSALNGSIPKAFRLTIEEI